MVYTSPSRFPNCEVSGGLEGEIVWLSLASLLVYAAHFHAIPPSRGRVPGVLCTHTSHIALTTPAARIRLSQDLFSTRGVSAQQGRMAYSSP